jgi:hypothetical protein
MQIVNWCWRNKTYEMLKKYTEDGIIDFKKRHPKLKKNDYPDELLVLFENYIFIYGHGWCMDVKSERRKMAKLWFRLLNQLKA